MEINASELGLTDFIHAARSEALRVIKDSKGDVVVEYETILRRLEDQELITKQETTLLLRLYKANYRATQGKLDPQKAFFAARKAYTSLAADGKASPLAVRAASLAVGAYDLSEGSQGTVVIAAYKTNYTVLGGLIGGAIGGSLGMAIGAAVGSIVDEKVGKKT